MKITKQVVLSFALLFFLSIATKAQENITQFLSGSKEDANILSKSYLEPFGKAFGTGLNSAWYNSGKPHKLGGFDITFSVATAIPPSSSKTFDVSKLNLNYWELQNPANKLAPTVTGEKVAGPVLQDKTLHTITMNMPKVLALNLFQHQ